MSKVELNYSTGEYMQSVVGADEYLNKLSKMAVAEMEDVMWQGGARRVAIAKFRAARGLLSSRIDEFDENSPAVVVGSCSRRGGRPASKAADRVKNRL